MKRKLLLVLMPFLSVSFFALSFFFIVLTYPVFYRDSEIFKGYHTVLIKSDVKDIIKKPFFRDSVSVYTAPVYFNDFTGEAKVSLFQLNKRLDKLDPRYDSYLKKINSYFHVKSQSTNWEAVYVPAIENPVSTYLSLHFLLDRTGTVWQLAGFAFLPRLISLVIILFFAGLLCIYIDFPGRMEKCFFISGLIPWVLNVIIGGIGDTVLFFPVFFSWAFIVRNTGKTVINSFRFNLKKRYNGVISGDILKFIVIGIYPLLIVLIFHKNISLAMRLSAVIIYNTFVVSFMALFLVLRIKYMEYNIFEPVQILRTASIWRNSWKFPVYIKKVRIITTILLVILTPIVFTIVNSINSVFLPVPVIDKRLGKDFNRQDLEILSRSIYTDGYPNIADYFVHRAFQEGFPLGMKYTFPGEDETLYLKNYSYNYSTGVISETLKAVKKYDSSWIRHTFASIPESSVAEMLFKQGRPVRIEHTSTAVRTFMLMPVWEILLIIVVFFFFLTAWKFSFALAYDFRRLYEES